jgi:hypothetical protein
MHLVFLQTILSLHKDITMTLTPELMNELTRCLPDITRLAALIEPYPISRCEEMIRQYIEAGETKNLGLFLNACALNERRIDPELLADALTLSEPMGDMRYQYRFHDQSAINPLIRAVLSGHLPVARELLAADIATELSVKFDAMRDETERMLNKLHNRYDDPESFFLITDCLIILKKSPSDSELLNEPLSIDRAIAEHLPATPPPNVIGGTYTVRRAVAKVGRNDSCHCGSGKKYKKCCLEKDAKLLQDSSQYAGLTLSEVREAPEKVQDTDLIREMQPFELKRLNPEKLNDDQLFAAFIQTRPFHLHDLAFSFLMELKTRPGKEDFATGHMVDLLNECIDTGDIALSEKIMAPIPRDILDEDTSIAFGLFLVKNRAVFEELENQCRQAFTDKIRRPNEPLIQACYHFERYAPALSIIFGRSFVIDHPDRQIDNYYLFKSIRNGRIDLGLEEHEDPVEPYADWAELKHEDELNAKILRDEIDLKNLELEEKAQEIEARRAALDKREKQLSALHATIEKERNAFQKNTPPTTVTERVPPRPPSATMIELKNRIERLKQEVREQQEQRKELKALLERERDNQPRKTPDPPPTGQDVDSTHKPSPDIPKSVLIPEYSDKFRKSCKGLPMTVTAKALRAITGFALHDPGVIKNTRKIESGTGLYRIKTEPGYRVMLHYDRNRLVALDLIDRKDLERWIKQHMTSTH